MKKKYYLFKMNMNFLNLFSLGLCILAIIIFYLIYGKADASAEPQTPVRSRQELPSFVDSARYSPLRLREFSTLYKFGEFASKRFLFYLK